MTRTILAALLALSTLAIVTPARADYFGSQRETKQGQNAPEPFATIEKRGI